MSIRLRYVEGRCVALCAYETDEKEGDIYIDDGFHYALAAKFSRDWIGRGDVEYPEDWALADTQRLRDSMNQPDDTPECHNLKMIVKSTEKDNETIETFECEVCDKIEELGRWKINNGN